MDIKRFVADLRARAGQLRRYAPEVANALADVADKLEAESGRWEAELLTLAQAAAESGYTASHLGRLIAQGKRLNAGEKHAPRLRRGDLPKKPSSAVGEPDLAGKVLRNRGLHSRDNDEGK